MTAKKPKLPPGRPAYAPSDKDRSFVRAMVAGGIDQVTIGSVLGIGHVTLRKYFRREIDVGAAEVAGRMTETLVQMALGREATADEPAIQPNFNAIKWYTQAKMGWSEKIRVDDGKLADTPMRVIVEFLGDPAPVKQTAQAKPRLNFDAGDLVQFVG